MLVPGVPHFTESDDVWNMSREFREHYVNVKYFVAAKYRPKRICEIGVYSGISALCFLAACPDAEYIGIDNLSAKHALEMVPRVENLLTGLNYRHKIVHVDSQNLDGLPGEFDLVHVDGDHSRGGTCHDVILAWKALSSGGHILVDNGHDPAVCAGTFDAIWLMRHEPFNWSYLSEGVGSILIERPA